MKLRYQLSQDEIEEALLTLNWRREGKFRSVNLWITSFIGVFVLIGYMKHPEQFFWFLLLMLIILLLLYMTYGVSFVRRRRAARIAGEKGEYRLEITGTHIIPENSGEKISLSGKKVNVMLSEHVFVIKTGRTIFTIPRRVLTEGDEEELKRTAGENKCSFINVVIGKE